MGDALLSGAVDAIVASEPTPSLVEERGGREIATLGRLGNTYPILLVARNDFLAAEPDTAAAFLRAMRRAARFIHDHPDESAGILAARTGLSTPVASRSMAHHYYALQLDDATRTSLNGIADFLLSQGVLDQPPRFAEAIDDSFLRVANDS